MSTPETGGIGWCSSSSFTTTFANNLVDHSGHALYRERLLFGVISQFSHHLFRGTKLVFHLLAVANACCAA